MEREHYLELNSFRGRKLWVEELSAAVGVKERNSG